MMDEGEDSRDSAATRLTIPRRITTRLGHDYEIRYPPPPLFPPSHRLAINRTRVLRC